MKKGILINDTSGEHHIGCDTVVDNIKRLSANVGIEIFASFTRQNVKNRIPKLKEAIHSCDIVIVNGEGSLHDSYGRNFLVTLLKLIPKGKKAVLINSLWYKMGQVADMNKFSLISFREQRSFNEFYNTYIKLQKKIYCIPDVIFAVDIEGNDNIGYGDSVSGNISNRLSKHDNYFPLDYKRTFKAKTYHQEFFADDVQYYIKWLKTLDLHVTGRFHGLCLSAIAGTPFLVFPSNAEKIEALLHDMGCSELLIKSTDEIYNKKELAKELVVEAMNYVPVAKLRIRNLFQLIGDIANE